MRKDILNQTPSSAQKTIFIKVQQFMAYPVNLAVSSAISGFHSRISSTVTPNLLDIWRRSSPFCTLYVGPARMICPTCQAREINAGQLLGLLGSLPVSCISYDCMNYWLTWTRSGLNNKWFPLQTSVQVVCHKLESNWRDSLDCTHIWHRNMSTWMQSLFSTEDPEARKQILQWPQFRMNFKFRCF